MRRITVLISTLAFAISGFVVSPASAVLEVPQVSQIANATPAVFASGIQSSSPSAWFTSVSCSSAGNCVAVGQFKDSKGDAGMGGPGMEGPGMEGPGMEGPGMEGHVQSGNNAFTQTQVNGIWGNARPVEFAAGIQNTNPNATFNSVSCSSDGNCVAVGQFKNTGGGFQAFTQTETNGIWGNATPVELAAGIQNTDPNANFSSVSCSSAGNCVAAGQFSNASYANEAFTQTQTNGTWGSATRATFVSGTQQSNRYSVFNSVSCSSAGNCVAAGQFSNAAFGYEAFTQTQTNGIWGNATPATFASGIQKTRPYAYFNSISCPSVGNCVAAGQFVNAAGGYEAFTQTQVNGTWGDGSPATFASGIQNTNPSAWFYSVSCPSAGNCVAVGPFKNAAGGYEAFTQTQVNGIWGTATPATFASGIQPPLYAGLSFVACSSVGNCVATGNFANAAGGQEAFTQTLTIGIWGNATPVTFDTGIQNNNRYAVFNSVSCSSAGNCVAAGTFTNVAGGSEAFTQTVTNAAPTNNYINSITQAKAWANVDFTLPALTTGSYDRVAYSIDGGSWTSWGLNAKSVQSIKGLPTGRVYGIRIRGHVKRGAWTQPSEPVTIIMKKIRGGVVVP